MNTRLDLLGWVKLIGLIIWVFIGPVSIVTFLVIGEFSFSLLHFYIPLGCLISSILWIRYCFISYNRENKLYHELISLKIAEIELKKAQLTLRLIEKEGELYNLERRQEVNLIEIAMIKNELEARQVRSGQRTA